MTTALRAEKTGFLKEAELRFASVTFDWFGGCAIYKWV